jgi:hypothetical protein
MNDREEQIYEQTNFKDETGILQRFVSNDHLAG